MKALLITIASIAVIAYLMEVKIQFQPLKVEFRNVSNGIAWILFVLYIVVYTYSIHKKAYRKGIDDTIQKLVELTEKEADNDSK